MTGRFVTRRNFEALALLSALLDLALQLLLYNRRAAVDGPELALLFTIVLPWFPLVLALVVTRLASKIAKWLLVVLVVLVWIGAAGMGIGQWRTDPVLYLGLASALAITLATAMLFTREGRRWTECTAEGDRRSDCP